MAATYWSSTSRCRLPRACRQRQGLDIVDSFQPGLIGPIQVIHPHERLDDVANRDTEPDGFPPSCLGGDDADDLTAGVNRGAAGIPCVHRGAELVIALAVEHSLGAEDAMSDRILQHHATPDSWRADDRHVFTFAEFVRPGQQPVPVDQFPRREWQGRAGGLYRATERDRGPWLLQPLTGNELRARLRSSSSMTCALVITTPGRARNPDPLPSRPLIKATEASVLATISRVVSDPGSAGAGPGAGGRARGLGKRDWQ